MSSKSFFRFFSFSTLCLCVCVFFVGTAAAQATSFAERVQKVLDRPEFAHSTFAMEFYSLDSGKPIFSLSQDKLMVPGSTTKLFTEDRSRASGRRLQVPTKIYRTGPIKKDGTLDGDLILVASGDANLSNRIQPDGTLAFETGI